MAEERNDLFAVLRKLGGTLPATGDAYRSLGLPATYAGANAPQFGRPDGEPPLVEDDHVAHVEPRDDMAAIRRLLAEPADPPVDEPTDGWINYPL